MANNCIDDICLNCGSTWCERGCGSHDGPSQESIDIYLKKRKEWCLRWNHPFNLGTKCDDITCSCGSKEVYID